MLTRLFSRLYPKNKRNKIKIMPSISISPYPQEAIVYNFGSFQILRHSEDSLIFDLITTGNVLYRNVYVELHRNYTWIVYQIAMCLGISFTKHTSKDDIIYEILKNPRIPNFLLP